MFKKFRHRAETKHMKMNDSALRDIIPSDDVSFTEVGVQDENIRIDFFRFRKYENHDC